MLSQQNMVQAGNTTLYVSADSATELKMFYSKIGSDAVHRGETQRARALTMVWTLLWESDSEI